MENPAAAELPEIESLRAQLVTLRAELDATRRQRDGAWNLLANREAQLKLTGDTVTMMSGQVAELQRKITEYARTKEEGKE